MVEGIECCKTDVTQRLENVMGFAFLMGSLSCVQFICSVHLMDITLMDS